MLVALRIHFKLTVECIASSQDNKTCSIYSLIKGDSKLTSNVRIHMYLKRKYDSPPLSAKHTKISITYHTYIHTILWPQTQHLKFKFKQSTIQFWHLSKRTDIGVIELSF